MPETKMYVSQLSDIVDRDESRLHTKLADLRVLEGGTEIEVRDDQEREHRFPLDEVAERTLSDFLGLHSAYIAKCPPELKAHNLNYWIDRNEDVLASLMVGPRGLETIYDPDAPIITVPQVGRVISGLFDPTDEIVTLRSDPTIFHADVIVANSIQVRGNGLADRPGPDGYIRRPGTDEEPIRVDDITHGGVRFLAYPTKVKAPVVQRYLNRVICANGLTMPVVDQQITLKGHTVTEVLADMEQAAEQLLATMDEALAQYAHTAEIEVPGNPLAVIRHLGRENNIPDRILGRALDHAAAGGLTQGAPVTSYDILNTFTTLANSDTVRYTTANRLQNLGGHIVHTQEHAVRRCERCAQLV